MKKCVQLLPIAMVMVVLLLGVFSCSKDNKKMYEDPPWLGGTSIETLEKRGNYTIYLKLMKKANYTEPISKQLFTLFVPNDEAFNAYFQKNGISSVDVLTKDEAVQLFTLHVLRNPRSRYQLIYEFVWNEEQGPDGEYAGLFFRKPTPSTSIPYNEVVRYYPAQKGNTLLMYTGEKLVPLFSKDYFEDFFGTADGSDYLFMYPESKWDATSNLKDKAMNWHNAMVLPNPENPEELEVRTASGFIFFIDQVVAPMPSLEEYLLAHQDKYGLYYDMMQRFATYGNSKTDDQKRVMYLKSYDLVSNIAEEQGPFTGPEVRMKDMYTAFIPSDAVLQDYLNKTVLKSYPSLDSVPKITLYYILQTQLSRSLGLISKISKSYFNSFGDAMTISKSDINSAYMCSNGVLYDMKRVLEPNVFTCVPGNLFFDANYSTFLYAMNQAGVISSLSNPSQSVTLFAPTNDQLEAYNIRYSTIKSAVEYKGQDKVWKNMKTDDLIMFVQDHIYNGVLSDLSGDGFVEMSSGNFLHYSNNQIYAAENQLLSEKVGITETLVNEKNGILYHTDKAIKSKYVLGKFLVRNKDVSTFKQLLVDTKMLDTRFLDQTTRDTIPNLKFLAEANYWTGFIPTNDAMAKAQANGEVPDAKADPEGLKKFLLYHFIRKSAIFDDGLVSGTFPTNRVDTVTIEGTQYSTLKITNVLNNLSIKDHSGQVVNVDHSNANFLVRKGVAHKITSVLKY